MLLNIPFGILQVAFITVAFVSFAFARTLPSNFDLSGPPINSA